MVSTSMFDDRLLEKFMHGFYGYGNYKGDYWFVGMEEGGGNSFTEIAQRLKHWKELGSPELADLGNTGHDLSKYQPTWERLIRINLSAKGQDTDKESIRAYQKDYLEKYISKNCLLELLPLPSSSLKNWLYLNYSQLPELESREKYRTTCSPYRAARLKQRIHEYQPKTVIFYSKQYIDSWKLIAELEFEEVVVVDKQLWIAKNQHTIFAITYHPTSYGAKNQYFDEVGKIIRSHRS